MKINVRNICYTALFAAIIAVCAQISVPMPGGVPFTMQTFAVALAGIVLGAKRGTLAAIVYILLGMFGAPVFTGFKGGFAIIFGGTGGFILSFPIMALCAGISVDLLPKIKQNMNYKFKKFTIISLGLISGMIINYLFGIIMFSIIINVNLSNAFIICVSPFILAGIIKAILAGIIGLNIRKILNRSGLI